MSKKVLLIRLSSLGDLILATSVLEGQRFNQPDWLTSLEFKPLLDAHPGIGKLHLYERKSGPVSWLKQSKQLALLHYDEVYDLHSTLRTRLLRVVFWIYSRKTRFVSLRKPRIERFLYTLGKRWLPKSFRPKPFIDLFQKTVGSTYAALPHSDYLVKKELSELLPQEFVSKQYWAIMPSSLWKGKCWPVEYYVQFLSQVKDPLVILGSDRDELSRSLYSRLAKSGVRVFNGVGVWSIQELATVLKHARLYFGNDTGLAHLSQALGTPAHVLFGPTTADFGFGPWLPGSQAIESTLWCRPCSKDGSACFRVWNRYQCMKELTPTQVERAMNPSK